MRDLLGYLRHRQFLLVSNREPYEHVRRGLDIDVRQPAGGLVSALDPTMRLTHGTWVAWGSGTADADVCDESGRVQVPPGSPAYTLRRVWLENSEVDAYYHGFANQTLWPLCHMLIHHYKYRGEFWDGYRAVNLRFAHAVADEAERRPGRAMAWIQDYHFALLPEFLRAIRPNLFIHQFWHIPFPPPDILRLLPAGVHDSILTGMLGNDLMAFQVERHATNFMNCVAEFVGDTQVDPDARTIRYRDRTVHVGAFPISVDFHAYEAMARAPAAERLSQTLRERYAHGTRQLGVCVDRVDYTKGIPERLDALQLLWESHAELRERFTFVCVCTPSRSDVPAYTELETDIARMVLAINERFGTGDWTPIVLINENIDSDLLAAVYRAADLCIVSSLQDGMNLVAKEFIAAQTGEAGVLLLSRFAGAAEEIDGAVLINPFNVDGLVSAIRTSLDMPHEERRRRMRRMRRHLSNNTIFDWLDSILARGSEIMEDSQSPAQPLGAPERAGPEKLPRVVDGFGTRLDGSPLAIFLDIDGTLSPIAATPSAAEIPIETQALLQSLSALPGVTVALVTGRAADDALRLSRLDDVWIIGNHGIEVRRPTRSAAAGITAATDTRVHEPAIREAANRLRAITANAPGALFEDKRWTLSVHYRQADRSLIPDLISGVERAARATGMRLVHGKKVVELRPAIDVNKGTACVALANEIGALAPGASLFYAGDDRTDEDAFALLRERKPDAVTVRVESEDARSLRDATHAEFMVGTTRELADVLRWLLAHRASVTGR